MNSLMSIRVLSYMCVNRVLATSVTHVKIVTVSYDSITTAGQMTQQQDQLDETGYLGSATPYCHAKVRFFYQYGPLLALNYFHENQSLLLPLPSQVKAQT